MTAVYFVRETIGRFDGGVCLPKLHRALVHTWMASDCHFLPHSTSFYKQSPPDRTNQNRLFYLSLLAETLIVSFNLDAQSLITPYKCKRRLKSEAVEMNLVTLSTCRCVDESRMIVN
jgi:hypothetical protein